jgi:LacI family transcriptional regulator
MASNITLRDVARQAGVATGTASQALNGRANVSPETREKVLNAANVLGYISKSPAASARSGSLTTIGMLVKHDFDPESTLNPFYGNVQLGVEAECRRHNIRLMYANIEVGRRNQPTTWPAIFYDDTLDGLLLIGTSFVETIEQIHHRLGDMPIVLIDGYAPHLPFDSVVINNIAGAEVIVEYLVGLGHAAIALIGWDDDAAPSVYERRNGYLNVLRRHHLSEAYIEPSALNRESGANALRRLLHRAPEISAVFACNDDTAIGILGAARELGLNVPADLSVVGFDNIELARDVIPALTTVHVHKRWLGMLGVRQLMARANEPDMPQITITLDTALVVRASSSVHPHSIGVNGRGV